MILVSKIGVDKDTFKARSQIWIASASDKFNLY